MSLLKRRGKSPSNMALNISRQDSPTIISRTPSPAPRSAQSFKSKLTPSIIVEETQVIQEYFISPIISETPTRYSSYLIMPLSVKEVRRRKYSNISGGSFPSPQLSPITPLNNSLLETTLHISFESNQNLSTDLNKKRYTISPSRLSFSTSDASDLSDLDSDSS